MFYNDLLIHSNKSSPNFYASVLVCSTFNSGFDWGACSFFYYSGLLLDVGASVDCLKELIKLNRFLASALFLKCCLTGSIS